MTISSRDHGLDPLVAELEEIKAYLGRPVRVLHIGNIANNAFHNAKLQRKLGLEADVLCYDYYHIMGCPEWEDADFTGSPGDDFAPKWYRLEMEGYERPKWFAQGPFELAARHLIALTRRNDSDSARLWRRLGVLNRTVPSTAAARLYFVCVGSKRLVKRVFWALMRPALVEQRARRVLFGRQADNVPLTRNRAMAFLDVVGIVLRWISLLFREFKVRLLGASPLTNDMLRDRAHEMCEHFRKRFPNRSDYLTYEECLPYVLMATRWSRLFAEYDIIQAYSTDPMWPMMTKTPYFAFEHGTLRDIPDEDSTRGRMTAFAYANAKHVFVTNSDCMPNARELAGERVTFINHPFDEDDALVGDWVSIRKELLEDIQADHLLLHPTRHDWVAGTGFADKGNDVFLEAFIRMHAQGLKVGLVMCEWGRNVPESRALLDEAGLSSFVRWEPPMSGRRLLTVARASELVVDQFKLGAFGGVTFKALAAGCCVCTKLDVTACEAFFGKAPPVVNCATSGDVLEQVTALLGRPERLKEYSAASREWVAKFHSGRQVNAAHIRQYIPHLRSEFGLPEASSAVD